MKLTTITAWRVIALASMIAVSSNGMAALNSDNTAPRQEDYANYSQYIQALFHSWKMQEDKAKSNNSSTSCSNEKTEQEGSQSNSCVNDTSLTAKMDIPGSDQYESLEDALDKRATDIRPEYNNKDIPRTSFNTFPLNPISSLDLEGVTAGDLLGVFNQLIYKNQTSNSADDQLASNNRPANDSSQKLYNDITSELYADIFAAVEAFGGLLSLDNITGKVDLDLDIINGGLKVTLNADVRLGLHIVDRDGIPGTAFSPAGAIDLDSMGLKISNLSAELKASSSASSNIIEIKAYTPDAIIVDLSNTKIGVADALADGSNIGSVTPVFSFGPNSLITIGPGVSLTTLLTPPDGLRSPLLTINGVVGTISLTDLSLIDQGASVFHIGKVRFDGLKLVNTKVYFDGPKMTLDLGTGITDASLAIERVSIGYDPQLASIGDFYVNNIRVISSRITMQPH